MSFLYFFSRSIINTYIPIYSRLELNLSDAEIASFTAYRSLAIMLIRFSSATFLARVPIRPFLLLSLALGGLTGFASPVANNYLSIVLILFLSGVSYGAVRILGLLLIAKNSTSKNRGLANSLHHAAEGAGSFTKILTSPIAETQGITPVFIIGGITGLIATVPILLRKTVR
jgi:sugar phosphate permease